MATVEDLLDQAEAAIRKSKAVDLWRPSDARVNAEELLGEVIGKEITGDDLDDEVGGGQRRRFEGFVRRRAAGEPVAMILGKIDFLGMELLVAKGAFIPRNSSELLAGEAIQKLKSRKTKVAVDVATGIGPVALAVAKKVKGSRVWGVDIAAKPLALARRNAQRLKLRNVQFLKSDMLAALPPNLRGKVDVFTQHPPYVGRRLVRTLPKEIKAYEPFESLTDSSDDGMGLVRRLAEEAPEWLRPGGWVLVEVSPDLSRKVASILRGGGLKDVVSKRDSLGATRVIRGRFR
jgi:release factor glutamine methyltransferase